MAPTCEHETGTCHPSFEHCSVRAWSCRLKSKGGKKRYFCGSNSAFRNCSIYYWLVVDLPLWKMMEFVSGDDEIPNIWKKNEQKMFQTTNQIFIICPCVPKTSPKCSVLAPFSDVLRLLEMTPASAAGPEAESPRISLVLARNWTWIIASRMITSATAQ